MKELLTSERLKEVLQYDPELGVFTWRKRYKSVRTGQVAGYIKPDGYRTIFINGGHRAHRLAWLYMTGEWPKTHIDHINGVRDDNRWANLREATPLMNAQNRRRPARYGSTGVLGAFKGRAGRFVSEIEAEGKRYYLGEYDTAQEAHQAYVSAKRRLHQGNTL